MNNSSLYLMLLIIHLHLLLKMLTAPVANAAVLTVTLLHHDRAPLRRHARRLTHTDASRWRS